MQLRQYQKGHINWFYTKNKSLTIIGGHFGFWQLWWYVKFLEPFIIFVILKNICIEVYLWWLEVEIRIFFFFFLGGGGRCSLDFHEGQLFVIYLLKIKSQKAFHMSTLFECRYLEDNLLVQSGDICIHEYKICFCKEVYISPYPKIVIFQNHVQ